MSSQARMDSMLPGLDCHEKMDVSTNESQQYVEVKVTTNTKLPLILRPEEDKSGQKQAWNKQAKRPRLHPSFTKINGNKDMGSLQQTTEKKTTEKLTPMPYQSQLFRSSTSLKMVPLKKFHRAVESINQQLPTQVTKSRLISFHSRHFPYQGDNSFKVCDQESFQPYDERGDEEVDGRKSHKRKQSGKLETEYRDLHVGGQHSRLMERDDGSSSRVCFKYGSTQRDSGESPPATAPTLREIHQSDSAIKSGLPSNQSVALKSLSLEEMSIKRNLIKSKNIQKKKEDQFFPLSNKSGAIVNDKRRIPPLLPEYQRKHKKKYLQGPKKPVAPKETVKEKKETISDRHQQQYHNESKRESKRFVSRDRTKDSDMKWKKHKDNQQEAEENQKDDLTNQTQLMQDEVVEPLATIDTLEEEEECYEEEPETEMSLSSEDTKTNIPEEPQKQTFSVPSSPSLLKLSDLVMYLSDERLKYLKEKFHKLDGDKDGHLKFCELETELPTNLSHKQKFFIKEVYDVISSSTFFGLSEFCTVTLICEQILQLPDVPTKSMDDLITSQSLQDNIAIFMMEFSKVDVDRTSTISMNSLKSALEASMCDIRSDTAWWEDVLRDIHRTNKQSINKVEFLCLIPYFLNLRVW